MLTRRRFLVNPLLWLTLACAHREAATAAPDPVVPTEGPWAVTFPDTWGGDCKLDDMDSRMGGTSNWEVELQAFGFTFYDEDGYPLACSLDDGDYACSIGTRKVSYATSGVDAVERITTTVGGTFTDPDTLAGSYDIAAECTGDDCGMVGTQYGDDFTYPCTAELQISGLFVGGG